MRRSIALVAPSFALAALLAPKSAAAIEFKDLAGKPLTVDITNTAITNYHFDNRNDTSDSQRKADPKNRIDDNYFEYIDRFNIQVGYWRFRLNVRLDGQTYAGTVDANNVAAFAVNELKERGEPIDSNVIIPRANQYLSELNTRYHSGIYPAKLSLAYQQPGIDITLGDFYAQLGRGMVLSVRKIDELGIDTTIRGGKVQITKNMGSFRFGGTLLAGQTNPQRVDEATGRILTSTQSPLFFAFPEPTRLQTYDGTTGRLTSDPLARPTFLSDTVIGGRLEGGHTLVQLAANMAVVLRQDNSLAYAKCVQAAGQNEAAKRLCDFTSPVLDTKTPSIAHAQIRTWSGSVMLPQLTKYGDLYMEVAGQQLVDGTVLPLEGQSQDVHRIDDLGGYAVYLNGNLRFGSFSLGLEGKHYRRFFTPAANVNSNSTNTPGYLASEFSPVAFTSPPTAEPIYVEPVGAPNVCNTGGRADARYRFNRQASIYGWLGYYVSFSELAENSTCEETDKMRTNTWDAAAGGDLEFEGGKTYTKAWVGARMTDLAVPTDSLNSPPGSSIFYREDYVRYDIVKHLTGAFSIQSQGFHRHRYLPERFAEAWFEGENYLALHWAPRLVATFGYEYTSQPGCSRDAKDGQLCHYVNGGLQWRGSATDGIWGQIFNSISLRVGQQRAAIRCVSGVCRQFPAFEGAKLEIVSRF